MSHNTPAVFGGGAGHPPPSARHQHPQQYQTSLASNNSQTPSTMAQQSAFLQNAQLPAMDNPALANISPAQLAEIARLFQIGALTVPPAPGETATPTSNATNQAAETPLQQNPMANPTAARASDTDKEEGEVEEMESENMSEQRDFLRPPPSGPRNGNAKSYSLMASSAGATALNVSKRQQRLLHDTKMSHQNGVVKQTRPVDKEYSAKAFVLEMVKVGKTFDDLAPLVTSSTLLARVFQELKIPAPKDTKGKQPAQPPNGTTSAQPQPGAPSKPPADEQRKVSGTKRPQLQPVDRNEYLARLQAAKNKKPDVTTVPTDESAASTTRISSSNAEIAKPSQAIPPAAKPIIDRTALVRERLEALKAAQAAKQNGPTPTKTVSSPPPAHATREDITANWVSNHAQAAQPEQLTANPDLGTRFAGLRSQQGLAQPQATGASPSQPAPSSSSSFLPPPSTPTSALGGLPGLFLGSNPAQVMQPTQTPHNMSSQTFIASATSQTPGGVPLPSVMPFNVSRKRPVASDFDDNPEQASTPKRPFGQSRTTSEDESLVIEVSDEESEDNAMDLGSSDADLSAPGVQTKSFRDVGPLRDFPPKPTLQNQPSIPSTPGSTTPGGYEQKVKDIEAMRRKIAEMEAKKKLLAPTATAANILTPASVNVPAEPGAASIEASFSTPDQQSTPKIGNVALATEIEAVKATPQTPLPPNVHSRVNSNERPVSAASLARQQEKERLRKRLLELEQAESADLDEAVEAAALRESTGAEVGPVQVEDVVSEVGEEEHQATSTDAPPPGTYATVEQPQISDDLKVFTEVDAEHVSTTSSPQPNQQVTPYSHLEPEENPQSATSSMPAVPESGGPHVEDHVEEPNANSMPSASQPSQKREDGNTATVNITSPSEEGELSDGSMSRFYGQAGSGEPTNESDSHVDDPASPEVDMDIDSDTSSEDEMEENEAVTNDIASTSQELHNDEEAAQAAKNDTDDRSEDLDHIPDSTMTEVAEIAVSAAQQAAEEEVQSPTDQEHDDTMNWASEHIEEFAYEPEDGEAVASPPGPAGKDAAGAASSDARTTELLAKSQSIDDDVGLESSEAAIVSTSVQASSFVGTHYTPYESPLQSFKDYRWHPQYLQTVPGGYKSMTFNHQIDPDKQLCIHELTGGKCNDPDCAYQHFRDMALNDKDLLRVMGTVNVPAQTTQERRAWNDGLAQVIKELRDTKSPMDASSIASRIARFRREFVGDATKFLKLD